MECGVCKGALKKAFSGKILNKYDVDYFFCENCEHLQTEAPFWLEEAYIEPIAQEDTGILRRNLNNVVTVSSVILSFYDKSARFLDFAGGFGLFVRLMRDIGFDFVWEDKYSKNLFARGFEHQGGAKLPLMTAFEVFEHLENPFVEIEHMFSLAEDILFTQNILPLPLPKQNLWWYYAPSSGQHISFYTNKTLDFIASKFNKKHLYFGEFHLFTSRDISKEEFKNAIQNDSLIYANNAGSLKSKISEDMNYIINKKAGLT